MGALAVVYLATSFVSDEGSGLSPYLLAGLAAIFLLEFFLRLWDAPSRRRYIRGHWLDFVSSIPLIGGLRALRLLRLLRLGAVLRLFTIAEHEAELHGKHRDSLWFVGPLLVIVWLGSAAAYWTLEHGINPTVHNFGDALYWSFITATTVGYGDVTPVTPEGRIVSGILIFLGIGLVGFASAQFTQRVLHSKQPDVGLMMAKLDGLDERIEALTQAISAAQLPSETTSVRHARRTPAKPTSRRPAR